MSCRFEEVITTRDRLRQIIGNPSPAVIAKVIDHIDDICRKFIAASPLVVVATRGADGLIDVSPKGDPAGFTAVLDDKTLAIPDRLGNKRVDSFENLLTNAEVGLIFFIPNFGYMLRVSGSADIVRDAPLQAKLAINGRVPNLMLIVHVNEAFWHCAKAIARSKIWEPKAWPPVEDLPSLAEAMVAHGKLSRSIAEQQSIIDADFEERMY
jgi:PPOX class probable FMN-dependent enzyme